MSKYYDQQEQEELFEWLRNNADTPQRFSSIVQNDLNEFPIPPEDLEEWKLRVQKHIDTLQKSIRLVDRFFSGEEG